MGNSIINKKIKILNQEYLITKLLGKGFFGDVFEGKNMNTNKFVAIKIINIKKVNEAIDNTKYNFKRIIDEQIKNMKKLKSDNTCELLDYYEDKSYFYLITKIYDTNLNQLFKEKFINGMPIKSIKEFFFDLMEIFKKMDDLSIIHGNINMEKILINYDNEDKTEFTFVLNTFSLRKYLDYNKLNLSKINRDVIAPEIIKGKEFDCKADIWSLGVMILTFLNKLNSIDLYKQIIPENINDKILEDLLLKMLKTNCEERINWKDFLKDEFLKEEIENKISYINDDWEEYTLVNGIRKGKGKYHYKSGNTFDCEFIYDKKTKKTTQIFDNFGSIECKFINDKREGDGIQTFNSGDKIECKFINDKKEGKAIHYLDGGDKIEFSYVNNKRNGDAVYYFKNGEKINFKYVNDIKLGKAYHYFKDGRIEFYYKNNERNGKAIEYYKLRRTNFQYVDEYREGKAITYFPDGGRIEFEYKKNKIVGKSIEYISNGDRIEYEFINGNREGKATEYYTNGDRIEFKYIKSLREGKAIEFFTNGDRIEFEYIKSLRNGNAIEYFVNGDRIEFKYIKNLREGKAVEYFINGDKIEFEYSKDKRHGKVIEYFINGNKLTYSFLNDIKQGDAILYFKNGENIKFKFKNDKKEGKAVQYFTNGDTLIFNYIDDKPKGKANKYNKDGQLIKEYENINDIF